MNNRSRESFVKEQEFSRQQVVVERATKQFAFDVTSSDQRPGAKCPLSPQ